MLALPKPDTREDAIAALIQAAEKLMDTDPIEAGAVQRLTTRLLKVGQAKPRRTEFELGQLTGCDDRRRQVPPLSKSVLAQVHTAEFIKGYEAGYKGVAA